MDKLEKVKALVAEAEEKLAPIFAEIDRISFENTKQYV